MRRHKVAAIFLSFAIAIAPAVASAAVISTPVKSAPKPYAAWAVIGCAGLIILAAMAANRTQNRQLSASEAGTCGIGYWVKPR